MNANTINSEVTMRDTAPAGGTKRFRAGDEILGRYVVENELGQGGMGVVYLCLDKVGGVKVAVKGLPPEVSHNADEMESVRENFQLVHELHHPNIANVLTLEKDARTGDYYLVMAYARGVSLKQWMRQHGGKKHRDEQLKVLRQIASALDYAHNAEPRHIIHRDVRPENVMVDEHGNVSVLDFGLAAQVRSSMSRVSQVVTSRSGTPAYKSPEQRLAQPQRAPSDQYSLGVIAYQMFAGELPYDSDDIEILKHAVAFDPVPAIPGETKQVNAIFAQALAKRPQERFASCGDFVAALDGKKVAKPGGTRSRVPAIVGLAAALAIAAGGSWWWQGRGGAGTGGTNGTAGTAGTLAVVSTYKGPKPGETKTITLPGGVPMTFCWCPATTSPEWKSISGGEDYFWMGSPEDEVGRCPGEKRHPVKLTKGFWIAQTPVTQRQYEAVTGTNPTKYDKGADNPVSDVTWTDCGTFCRQLAAKLDDGSRFALPTEAQWEYACRAGTTTALNNGKNLSTEGGFCPNLSEVAWYEKNSDNCKQPVKGKRGNTWNLYDMHGNVWEWCVDYYGSYGEGIQVDPTGATSGFDRAKRGGGFYGGAQDCRSAIRGSNSEGYSFSNLGFRPVRILPNQP